jgi:hypothetical protein
MFWPIREDAFSGHQMVIWVAIGKSGEPVALPMSVARLALFLLGGDFLRKPKYRVSSSG